MLVRLENGKSVKGRNHICFQQLKLTDANPVTKVTTTVGKYEVGLYSLELTFADGTKERLGKVSKTEEGGRQFDFVIGRGERLIGCDLYHGEDSVLGVRWVKWLPSMLDDCTMRY